jgi:hypothetical protein
VKFTLCTVAIRHCRDSHGLGVRSPRHPRGPHAPRPCTPRAQVDVVEALVSTVGENGERRIRVLTLRDAMAAYFTLPEQVGRTGG